MAEICDNAKKGREYALLGNYDSSMVYYQGVIQQIQRHCQSIRDPAVKSRWQQVRALGSVQGGGQRSAALERGELENHFEILRIVLFCLTAEIYLKCTLDSFLSFLVNMYMFFIIY